MKKKQSALDKVLDFSIDEWTDMSRAGNSKERKLLEQANAELAVLETQARTIAELREFVTRFMVSDETYAELREAATALLKRTAK